MEKNTEFYNRILNGTYTSEDVEKFEGLCACYSDMYKDIYGVRPRDERTMCERIQWNSKHRRIP